MNKLPIALLLLASCSPDPTPPPPKAAPEAQAAAPAMAGPAMMMPPERTSKPAGDVIQFDPPAAWVKEDPSSTMRKAQYKVPDKDKKGKDAQLAVFYFGPNNEMLEANVKRWAQQMGADDPKSEVIQGKCKVTLVDLKGTYTGDKDAGPMENSRLLAAVVEAADGPWYFKLVGPADTVGPWREDFVGMLKAAGGK